MVFLQNLVEGFDRAGSERDCRACAQECGDLPRTVVVGLCGFQFLDDGLLAVPENTAIVLQAFLDDGIDPVRRLDEGTVSVGAKIAVAARMGVENLSSGEGALIVLQPFANDMNAVKVARTGLAKP